MGRGSPQPPAPHRCPNPRPIERVCCERRKAPSPSPPPLDRVSTSLLPHRRCHGPDCLSIRYLTRYCLSQVLPIDLPLEVLQILSDGSCNRRDLGICVNCQVHDERTFQWRDLSHIKVPMQRSFLPKQSSEQRKGSKETEFNNLCEEAGFLMMAFQSLNLWK